MNNLKTPVIKIKGNAYRVTNIKVPWAELKKTTYFKAIVICLLRGSDRSRIHIISISHSWIFDSNLDFAFPLNKESLDWSCDVKQNDSTFNGCW